jgi:phosphopantetheinyl transferase (holo-ACP synthase)
MAPGTNLETAPARTLSCSVGLLGAGQLRGEQYARLLSTDERANYLGLPKGRRKEEWLAGRLAAKHVFLDRLERSKESLGPQWRPTLTVLTPESLCTYSPWMYRQVEVHTSDGKPSLVWCGTKRRESISLSHAGGVSCASISLEAPTAIDIETAAPRVGAFYRNNFTEAEREWAHLGGVAERRRSNWYFTLLWTLKESVLKLGWLKQAGVWELPRIEIDGLPGFDPFGPFWSNSTIGSDFLVFTARAKEACRVMQVQVAVSGTRNFVLTVMNPRSGVSK